MSLDEKYLRQRVTDKEAAISVVGLGYVGLNIACLFAQGGFRVYGFDVDEGKLAKLRSGENYIPEEDWLTPIIADAAKSHLIVSSNIEDAPKMGDFVIVAVDTKAEKGTVDYSNIAKAAESIAKGLTPGKVIIFESTIEPGTTENMLRPVLERESGLKAGIDFGLAFSPERIDPGNKRMRIQSIPKVVGGFDPLSTELAALLYSQAIDKVIPVSSLRVAEMMKVMENTQRDVNIALTNLFALEADKLGVDIEEVLAAAATKWNFIRMKPGCGIGGQCISDVAYMAISSMKHYGVDAGLIEAARKINEFMPSYTVEKIIAALKSSGKGVTGAKIAVLGIAYKRDSSDTKNSPALEIIERLGQKGAKVLAYDPFIKDYPGIECRQSLAETIDNCDCIVITTDHTRFEKINFNGRIIIDGRNILRKQKNYHGIGR